MSTDKDPIHPIDIVARLGEVVRAVYPELDLIRRHTIARPFQVPLPPRVVRRTVPSTPPPVAHRPLNGLAALDPRGQKIAAVVTWLEGLKATKLLPKKRLQAEAMEKFPDLEVREFYAAYKKAFGRPRGRPRGSY